MNPEKPKPRTVWLIVNPTCPKRFLHHVGHTEQEATEFRDRHFPKAKVVRAEVKAK